MSDAAIRAWPRAGESRSVCNVMISKHKITSRNTLKLVFRAEYMKKPLMWMCYFLFL